MLGRNETLRRILTIVAVFICIVIIGCGTGFSGESFPQGREAESLRERRREAILPRVRPGEISAGRSM